MNDSRKCILVTGGAGYIGAHACKALAKAGYTPVAYDNLVYGHSQAVKWGPLEEGDISDPQRLDTVMREYNPKAVMHFAAYAYVGESVENPAKYYRNNVAGTLNLLESMRNCDINKLIFSSTCATYGMPEQIPIREDHPQYPINPYGRSKLMIEWILRDFAKAYDLKFVSLRYFNAAGADPDADIGEANDVSGQLLVHFPDHVYRTVIPRNVRLAEAPSHGRPVINYDRKSRGALAYLALAGEMLRKQDEVNIAGASV